MVDSCHESALHGRERSSPGELVQAARALPGAVHSDIVAAQCRFNIIQRVTDLRRKRFAGNTVNNVLILKCREFSAPAKGLPQPYGWNVSYRFALHE